jgi:hypothetical protein
MPIQYFDLITLAIAESKQRGGKRVEIKGLLNDQNQSIDLLAHIDRFSGEIDLGLIGETQHRLSTSSHSGKD